MNAMGEHFWVLAGLGAVLAVLAAGWLRDKTHKRRLEEQGRVYRPAIYREIHLTMWALALAVIACWLLSGRTLASLGFVAGEGWGWIGAWAIAFLFGGYVVWSALYVAFSERGRADVRRQIEAGGDMDLIMPETAGQHRRFYLVALTAGITEEIIFRGFLIGAIGVWASLPAAAVAATVIFLLGHLYQGWKGMMKILPISAVLALVYVISGSLWPGMVLHFLVDAAGGAMMYLAMKSGGDNEKSASAEQAP